MTVATRTFRVFISSTFSDLKAERNALQERVFPRLRALAESHGCRFQAIDLRWGVSEEAGIDQQTMKICLGEVHRCQVTSPRPNFIILLGNRYGWRPLPFEIREDEFNSVLSFIPEKDRPLVYSPNDTGWYRRDENAVPHVFVLQPRTAEYLDYASWEPVEHKLHDLLETAAIRANLPELDLQKYTTSATEQEINQGAIQVVDAREHVFCFAREVDGFPQDKTAEGFLDLEAGKPYSLAAHRLLDLKDRLKGVLRQNYHEYAAHWEKCGPSLEHLDRLCEDVYGELEQVISKEVAALEQVDLLEKEFSAHQTFGRERARHFIGRAEILKKIDDYLLSKNNHPLAVWGESGSGKSAVIARAIQEAQKKHPQAVILGCFIGATPNSSNGRALLEILCRQITRVYGGDESTLPSSYNELVLEFPQRLALATKEKPLVVFLDALDQLSGADNARNLAWLPAELPPHARLVVSTIPGECLQALALKTPVGNRPEIASMPLEEGKALLNIWLDGDGRTLQPGQRADILGKYERCGLPLYLKLAFEEARRWRSYDGLPKGADDIPGLGEGIPGILRDLFWRLSQESNHGELLVNRSLGCLAAARNGLSEDEILDVLSADAEVLRNFHERFPKSPEVKHLPVVVWSRLYLDLEPYLTERKADGTTLLSFYHRQLAEAVAAEYLAGEARLNRHQALAQYFGSQSLYLESAGRKNPNLRKLSEQTYQQAYGVQEAELVRTLTDFGFFEAKIEAFGPYPLLEDYTLAALFVLDPSSKKALGLLQDALLLASNVLFQDHSQLAAQILGRLLFSESPQVQGFLAQAAQPKGRPWLRPLTPSLTSPGGSLLLTIEGENRKIHKETARGTVISENWISSLTTHGENIISGFSDGTIKIHDLNTGDLLRTLTGHTNKVRSVAATPDGKLVVSGSCDQTLKVWDLLSGREKFTLKGHSDYVNSVAVTPDGRRVISASGDCSLKIWDLEKRTILHTLRGHEKAVAKLVLSGDGKRAFSLSSDETIKVWDVEKKILLKTLPGFHECECLAITPDDRMLLVSTSSFGDPRNGVMVVDSATGTLLRTLTGHHWDVNAVTVTPDGQRIISGSEDSSIKIWDAQTGEELADLKGHTGEVNYLSVTSDDGRLVSAAHSRVLEHRWDITIRVWDLQKIPGKVEFEGSRILYAAVRPNHCLVDSGFPGKAIQALSQEKSVKIRFLASVDGKVGITQETGPDWKYSRDTLAVWDLAGGTELCQLTGHDRDVVDWKLTADGNYVLTASWDKTLKVYDYIQGKEVYTLRGHSDSVQSVELTSDGHQALSSGDDQILMFWNIPKGERLFSLWGHTAEVTSAVFTPDGKCAVSISRDHTLKAWDLETKTEKHGISHDFIEVKPIIVTPDGKKVIINESQRSDILGAQDFTLKVWDLESSSFIHSLEGHTGVVIDALVTQDGRYLLSTSHDHTLRVWDLKTGWTVARFVGEDSMDIRAISPDGTTVLVQGQAGQVHFLRLEEHDFGPAIVTARRLPKPQGLFRSRKPQSLLEVTCIQCNAVFEVDDGKLGAELACLDCGRILYLNQTVL